MGWRWLQWSSHLVTSLTTPDRGVAGSSPAVDTGWVASPEVSLPAGTAVSPASAASKAGRHRRARLRRLQWFAKRELPNDGNRETRRDEPLRRSLPEHQYPEGLNFYHPPTKIWSE